MFVVLLDKTEREPDVPDPPLFSLSVASLWPRRGGMVLGPTSQMSLFLLPLLVRTALSAV